VQIYSESNISPEFNENNKHIIANNSFVEVEVNINKKAVFFFMNHKQYLYYVFPIPSSVFPLLFGISGHNTSSVVEVISVQKLLRSSFYVSAECEKISWNISEEDDL
jgi:hypothetical protein